MLGCIIFIIIFESMPWLYAIYMIYLLVFAKRKDGEDYARD